MERRHVMGCRVTDRGDIVMVKGEEGYKVSGSAYKVSKDIAYHHGTMLLGSNLAELRKALRVDGRVMIRDKGVDSVRANHVANVPFPGENNNAKFNDFVQVVKEEFEEMHGKHRFIELSERDVENIPEVKKNLEQLNVCHYVEKLMSRVGIGNLDRLQSLQNV
jgi:lipoate-protein ligase A